MTVRDGRVAWHRGHAQQVLVLSTCHNICQNYHTDVCWNNRDVPCSTENSERSTDGEIVGMMVGYSVASLVLVPLSVTWWLPACSYHQRAMGRHST